MRSASITLLVAALASVCSAAPAPGGFAAAGRLPAQFSLSYISLDKTTTDIPLTETILYERNYGSDLIVHDRSRSAYNLAIFTTNGTSAFVPHPEFTRNMNWTLAIGTAPGDPNVSLVLPEFLGDPRIRTEGLSVSATGSLVWDLGDGAAPQSKWMSCWYVYQYQLYWDSPSPFCIKLDLKVHAV